MVIIASAQMEDVEWLEEDQVDLTESAINFFVS